MNHEAAPHSDTDLSAVMSELAAVRAELAELRSNQQLNSDAPTDDDQPEVLTSRRRLFALAGGAAAAAVVAGTMTGSRPAAAANGSPILIDATTSITPGAGGQTTVNYGSATSASNNLFLVTDSATGSSYPAAVAGYAYNVVDNGVYGFSAQPAGSGVVGWGSGSTVYGILGVSPSFVAVAGKSSTGYDFSAIGTGRVMTKAFKPAGPPSLPTEGTFAKGEILRDAVGDYFVCVADGSPGAWRSLGGTTTAGALHVINPTRVYDSRFATQPTPNSGGVLSSGANRVVRVADSINLATGAAGTLDVVPAGATAMAYNIAVANATAGGFIAVTPGDSTDYSASTINWSVGTTTLANGTLVKLAADRTVKVFAGGGGSADFVIDVVGYYI